jgi:acetyl esterase
VSGRYDWAALHEERLARLSPEIRAALKARASSTPFEELGVEGLRRQMEQFARAEAIQGVRIEEFAIPGPATSIPVRAYKPLDQRPLPVCLYLHGGGFIGGGGFDAYAATCSRLALAARCIVLFPDFRLPPEHKFPASVEDCWAVLQWIALSGESMGGDPSRIAVGGGCTGATHSAAVAIMARDAGLRGLRLQWLFDALLDARCDYASHEENAVGYQLRETDNRYVIRRYLEYPQQRWDWRVSPVLVPSLRGVAPALIIAGEFDILRDEMQFYAHRLQDAGVEVDFRCFRSEGHAFSFGEGRQDLSIAACEAREAQITSLRRAFA